MSDLVTLHMDKCLKDFENRETRRKICKEVCERINKLLN
jgi:hypothetical protein